MAQLHVCNKCPQPNTASSMWWVGEEGFCNRSCPEYSAAVKAAQEKNFETVIVPYLVAQTAQALLYEKHALWSEMLESVGTAC